MVPFKFVNTNGRITQYHMSLIFFLKLIKLIANNIIIYVGYFLSLYNMIVIGHLLEYNKNRFTLSMTLCLKLKYFLRLMIIITV